MTKQLEIKLPLLPEWSKMDDLGGRVPSQVRQGLIDYATAAVLANNTLQAESMGVPEGWKLVPIELTEEMINAYLGLQGCFQSARADWAALLKAAPKQGEPK